MELAVSTLVRTDVLNDDEFKDVVLQSRIRDTDALGGVYSVLFFLQDATNYYEFRVDTSTGTVSLFKVVAGVPTQIGADIVEDIVPKASYFITITTSFNTLTSDTTIKTFVDTNQQHEVIDGTYEKGKFGYKTDGSTIIQVTEIELMELPVDIRRIDPNFSL